MPFIETIVPANRLWHAQASLDSACLFVEWTPDCDWSDRIVLPQTPVILIGDAPEPLASAVDCRVRDRAAAENLYAAISANPLAARVIVDLLRSLPGMSLTDGLTMESLAYGVLQGSGEFARWLEGRPRPLADMPEGNVLAERHEEVLTLTFDRAAAGNAIDRPMRDALNTMLQLAVVDDTIEQVLVRARGKAFSLGADLGEFGTTRDPAQAHAIRSQTLPARWAAGCGHKMEVHIDGACVGAGLELAAYARRITATSRAWFQLPELAMGLLPGAGGCVSLTRRIGHQRTCEMILSGRRISARTALEWGLVDEITGDESRADD
ncbi:enoyl-CoA hydratase/isomerase family protein [Novosphingobium sp. TH158]|uniref:enoyl-CoA hydratase/isomerase family protein n=1 Tax=Novosphingobium sp. TH158 TaxID=2067455 RepID=UPI000C79EA47|nr:enoyl-CoA hydratase/isomerase family protein [Novosphingobium sp. TH158]PLK26169.1 enoyl-CoA hydratase/isomerase family protein [Novosphingobium sp. TH158]